MDVVGFQEMKRKSDMETRGTALALDEIVIRAHYERRAAHEKLEIEESGREVASLQGHIAGYKLLVEYIIKSFNLSGVWCALIEDNNDLPLIVPDLSDEFLSELKVSANDLIDSEVWQNVMNDVILETDRLKNYLLFTAEKSRDLDFCQGKYSGMNLYESLFSEIDTEINRREEDQKKKQEENAGTFDFDGPAGEPGISSSELRAMENA